MTDERDITERLHGVSQWLTDGGMPTIATTCQEANTEITRLRSLLREACDMARAPDDDPERWYGNEIPDEWFDRAALEGKP